MGLFADIMSLATVPLEELSGVAAGAGRLAQFGSLAIPPNILGSAGAHIFTPPLRFAGYLANTAMPSAMPGPEMLWASYLKGDLSLDRVIPMLQAHGIDFGGPRNEKNGPPGWSSVFWSMTTDLSVQQLNAAWAMGFINDATWERRIRRLGVWDQDVYRVVRSLRQAIFGIGTIRDLVNRGFLDDDTARKHLAANGIIEPKQQDQMLSMRVPLPGVGSVVQFAAKDVDDEAFVFNNQLDTGLEKMMTGPLAAWLDAQGISEYHRKLMWRSHWSLPSPGQMMDMVRRLRPGKALAQYQAVVPNARTVTLDEARAAMVASGVAPAWADNLAALSYSVVTRRDSRLLLEQGVWTKPDVVEHLKDQGYVPQQANDLATALDRKVRRPVLDPILRVARGKISEGYRLGVLDRDQCLTLLKQYGLRPEEAATALAALDVEESIDSAVQIIAGVKRMRLSGAYDRVDAVAKMVSLGILQDKANKYADLWDILLETGRKSVGAEKLVDWLKRGLVNVDEFTRRLRNMGYRDDEIGGFLLAASQDIALSQLKALQAAAKDREHAAKLAAARIKALADAHKQAVAELRSHGSPSQIARWVVKGIISYDEGAARLEALDWPLDDAMHLLDAAVAKGKK